MERKSCQNCWRNRDGDCKLYSSPCATAVFNKAEEPPRWTSIEEGLEADIKLFGKERVDA